jgi:glycosyltransferase involved in cell wall biosynthesis
MSRPNEYRFNKAPELDKLIEILNYKGYTITFQVLNFQGKVIGVFAKHNKDNLEGFIPCYPSALTILKKKKCQETPNKEEEEEEEESKNNCEYDFVYMNDDVWKPYEQTLKFLKKYYDYEEPNDIMKANCFDPKYFCRVVEDELITGFLTNTDQFVPIKDPIPVSSVDDTIKTISNNNMLVADINTLTNNSVDSKRVDFIKRIQLETNFYNVFRNTIRILFNDYLNSQKRKTIRDECNKKYSLYKNKLDKVIELYKECHAYVYPSRGDSFGMTLLEAMACGSPVITTDWGAFTETVIDGVTGFRCHTLQEFVDAAEQAKNLDRKAISQYSKDRYGLDTVGLMYERYFNRLLSLWGKGWYELSQ